MPAEQKLLSEQGTVEQKEKGQQMMMQLVSALTNPIIGHRGWEDSITPEQKARIKIERMKQIAETKGQKVEVATEFECLVYISTASLAQPLSQTWFRIYTYLFRKFYPEQAKEIFEEYEGQKLDIQGEQELVSLKRWLHKQSKKP